jgi:hypothetical protein
MNNNDQLSEYHALQYKGVLTEEPQKNSFADQIIPQALEEMYYISGRTGAEAMVAFWTDVANGKYMDLCKKLQIPNHYGLVHSSSTLAKHFIESGKVDLRKD